MSKQSCKVIYLRDQQSVETYRVRKETAEIDEWLKAKRHVISVSRRLYWIQLHFTGCFKNSMNKSTFYYVESQIKCVPGMSPV